MRVITTYYVSPLLLRWASSSSSLISLSLSPLPRISAWPSFLIQSLGLDGATEILSGRLGRSKQHSKHDDSEDGREPIPPFATPHRSRRIDFWLASLQVAASTLPLQLLFCYECVPKCACKRQGRVSPCNLGSNLNVCICYRLGSIILSPSSNIIILD